MGGEPPRDGWPSALAGAGQGPGPATRAPTPQRGHPQRPGLEAPRAGIGALDLVGLGLFAGAAAWALAAETWSGGDAVPVAGLFLAAGVGWVAGRVTPSGRRHLVPALIVAGALAFVAWSLAGALGPPTRPGPFGYANAWAALFVQAGVAGLMVGRRAGRWSALGAAAPLFLVAPAMVGSLAASALAVGVAGVWLAARSVRAVRIATGVCGAAFLAVLAATVAVAATSSGTHGDAGGLAARVLGQRRVALWGEALRLMGDEPLSGVGPGRFAENSVTAASDADARWAHHEFLQQGAEGGIPAFVLAVALVAWGFVRLLAEPRPDAMTALAAAGLAALAIQACVDYVLRFPAVPIAAAALVGIATQGGRPLTGRRR